MTRPGEGSAEELSALGRRAARARWAKARASEPFAGSFLEFLAAIGRSGPTRETWGVFWKVADGLPLTEAECAVFARHTGRAASPTGPAAEVWLAGGRRGGKSENMIERATWRAVSRNWRAVLSPGEVGVIPLIASDRAQARNSLNYLKGLTRHPLVAPFIARVVRDSVEFTTGAVVQVATASFKSTRGYTMLDAILEECAFYASEDSANPDEELANAIRPALITVPGARLYGISSPYARRGILWQAYEQHWGRDDSDVLVWNADTLSLNPTVSHREIERAFERDATVAASEYGRDGRVAFRADVERFLSMDVIDGVIRTDRPLELSPQPGVTYHGWADPSGGSQDSFAIALAHRVGPRVVLDLVRERRPPFSPDAVVEEVAGVFRAYGVHQVSGDHYAGAWVTERFAKHGVRYVASARTKTSVYREVLPLFNAGRAELPNFATLRLQLANLERRVSRSGQDAIGALVGAHDDVSDAACGALVLAAGGGGTLREADPKELAAALFGLSADRLPASPALGDGQHERTLKTVRERVS